MKCKHQYYICSGCLVRMSDGTDWHSKWCSPKWYNRKACIRYMLQWESKEAVEEMLYVKDKIRRKK